MWERGSGEGNGVLEKEVAVNRKPTFLGHIFALDGTLNLLTYSKFFVSISFAYCIVKVHWH